MSFILIRRPYGQVIRDPESFNRANILEKRRRQASCDTTLDNIEKKYPAMPGIL